MPRWSLDADGSPTLHPLLQPQVKRAGSHLSPPPPHEKSPSPPAAVVSPRIPLSSVAYTAVPHIHEAMVYPEAYEAYPDTYTGTVGYEADTGMRTELLSTREEARVLKRELEAQGKVLTCAIDRHKRISTHKVEQFYLLRRKIALALKLGQCRVLSRKYYEKLDRWRHHSVWMREVCPHRRARSGTRRSVVPPKRKPSSVFPENDVTHDQLRRELVAARAKIISLKDVTSVMEKTVVDMAREKEVLLERITELEAPTPAAEASIPQTPPDAAPYTKSLDDTLAAVNVSSVQVTSDKLHSILQGMNPSEEAIFEQLATVKTQADWLAINRTFKRQHLGFKGGLLRQALASVLTQRELDHCKEVLRENGVVYLEQRKVSPRKERPVVRRNPPKRREEREVAFGRVVAKKPVGKKVREEKVDPSPRPSVSSGTPLAKSSPMPFLPPAEVVTASNDIRVQQSPSPRSKIVSPASSPRRPSKSTPPRAPSPQPADPSAVVYHDSDGDTLVFIMKYEGICYSVNGEERPATRCVVVSEAVDRLDFPDINKQVELPTNVEEKREILHGLRALAVSAGVGHNILESY